MARRQEKLPDWAERDVATLASLHGRARLEREWEIGERLKAAGDLDAYVDWLKQILRTAWKESRFDYKLRAFAELRRIHREDARYADLTGKILWYYKWLVEELPEYTDISLATMTTLFDEMEAAYRAAGVSLRPVYQLRSRAAVLNGRSDEAAEWHEKWRAEPAGKSDDCAACEADREVAYLIDRKAFEAAMAVGEPVLRGQVWCDDSPETLTRLTGVAVRLGRVPLATLLLRATGRSVRRSRSMLASLAAQVVYQLMTGNPQRARRLAIVCMRRAHDAINDADRYAAYRSCGMWTAMSLIVGLPDLQLPARLMPGATGTEPGGMPLAEVAGLCLAEAERIAGRFDARDGTSRYTTQLKDLEQAIRRSVERGTAAGDAERA